jgi:polyprenyldihydroxybenzoate methyltransferase / 3-demethylubiquinol 3-O-methyltransferase
MLHTLTQIPLLRIARPSHSTLVQLCPSTSASLHHQARDINHRHHQPASRRQQHDYLAGDHHPRGDQPQPPPPPPISTVNDAEVSHFSRLSALWWDERGEFALLHKMNPHRIRFIREKVLEVSQTQPDSTATATSASSTPIPPSVESPRVLEGMDVLDVGCGGGILSEVRFFSLFSRLSYLLEFKSLARLGANTLAIDASAENIGIATRHAAADPGLTCSSAAASTSPSATATLSFRHAAAETLVQEPKRFDIVCSMEVVEHVDNPAAFLRSCAELVKVRI